MSAIGVRLVVRRGGFRLDVDVELPAHGVSAIFGPSGSGKTTLLRGIAGLEPAAHGRVDVDGELWLDSDRGVYLPPYRRQLGCVFQEPSLFAHLTVRRNLEYGLRRTSPAARHLALDEVVAWLALKPLLARHPGSLSGGEAQRVSIGRALLRSPRLLLLDEPLVSLDARAQAEIFPYLERLHRELSIPILYVSHVPDDVLRLADHVLLLEHGAVRASGPLTALSTRLDLLPWAGAGDAAAVVQTRVTGHDEQYELTELDFSGGRLQVPRLDEPVGTSRRVRILARDVGLALEPPQRSSFLNIVAAQVVAVGGGPRPLIQLIAGDTQLLAQVTRKSSEHLGLAPGVEVHALIKGVAILE